MLEALYLPLNFLDGLLANWFSGLVRLCIWGCMGGSLAMLMYLVTSDQEAISALKKETRDLRMRMLKVDLPHNEVTNLMKENLLVSLRFLRKVLTPSLLAAIPVLLPALWIGSFQSYTLPGHGESVSMEIVPADSQLNFQPESRFVNGENGMRYIPDIDGNPVNVMSKDERVYGGRPDNGPVSVIYQRQWWNVLVENSAGYINPESTVQEIHLNYPRKLFLTGVPEWLATWEFPYFLSVFIVAIVLKVVLRIQ